MCDSSAGNAGRVTDFFDHLAVGIAQVDGQGRIVRANLPLCRMLGYPLDDMIGKPWRERLLPWGLDPGVEAFEGLLAGKGDTFSVDRRVVRRDGSVLWVTLTASAMPHDNGSCQVLAVLHDICERVNAERALRESEARFRSLADNARACIFMIQHGRILYANQFLQDLLGRSMAELAGMDPLEMVHCDFHSLMDLRNRDRVTGLTAPGSFECILLTRDGRHRWVDISPGQFEYNGQPAIIAIAADITDRKLVEQQLRGLNETLEQRIAERTAEAQHRLTQLRSLSAQLAHAENHERKRLARILHDHLQQLLFGAKLKMPILRKALDGPNAAVLQQVEDLLQQSITMAKNLAVELSPPVLHEGGLGMALTWLSQWMQEKHQLTVHVQADPAAEPESEQTKTMLFQAARELLFNVVKHAKVQKAQVRMTRVDNSTRIIVLDRGKGFDSDHIDIRENNGSFGLLNVRERLEIMGGTIEIRSRRGHGTIVSLTAPIAGKTARPAAGQYVPDRTEGLDKGDDNHIRVLLADDHKIFRDGLTALLTAQRDVQVVGEACDGREALQLAQETAPDVVVMDVSMPRMDGVEATRRIVQACPQVQIIALSMHQSPETSRTICEAGAAVYLTKDGPSDALLAAIRRCAETRTTKG